MSETNLLHYIQSWDFVDQLIEDKTYAHIYADVWHLFPNCTALQDFVSTQEPAMIILARLTVAQLFEMYDIVSWGHITIVNLRTGVAGIGHKFIAEMDDIALMTWYGWTTYEPVSLADLTTISSYTDNPTYIRVTHRYLPSHMEMSARGGMWYAGEMSSSVTFFPASMIEAVGWLDADAQRSQYVMISDWWRWYLSDEFSEIASLWGSSVLVMEQSPQAAADYIDGIKSLYPKHRFVVRTVGTDIREGDVIVDEYRDERYGCDSLSLGRKL